MYPLYIIPPRERDSAVGDGIVKKQKRAALSVILVQVVVTLAAGGITVAVFDLTAATSVWAGGGISIIATVLFSLRVFGGKPEFDPGRFLHRLYLAEIQKITIASVLFIALFKWTELNTGAILLGFSLAVLAHWLALPTLRMIERVDDKT